VFIKHLLQFIRFTINEERKLYALKKKFINSSIVRPFSVVSPERLSIGENVLIQRNCHFHCGGLTWSEGKGSITVGDNCWFSENNVLYGAGEIEIGSHTGTGPGVMVFSSRDDYSMQYAKLPNIVHQFAKVTIGSYVRIFSNVVIVPGVTIGDGAVIGAGSVVMKDVPEWTVAVGNPARVMGRRDIDIPIDIRKRNIL